MLFPLRCFINCSSEAINVFCLAPYTFLGNILEFQIYFTLYYIIVKSQDHTRVARELARYILDLVGVQAVM